MIFVCAPDDDSFQDWNTCFIADKNYRPNTNLVVCNKIAVVTSAFSDNNVVKYKLLEVNCRDLSLVF